MCLGEILVKKKNMASSEILCRMLGSVLVKYDEKGVVYIAWQ